MILNRPINGSTGIKPEEQGIWPTKTMVSMWFKNETNLVTMIDLLKVVREELRKVSYKIHGQNVTARLDVSPQKKPLAKAHFVLQGTRGS